MSFFRMRASAIVGGMTVSAVCTGIGGQAFALGLIVGDPSVIEAAKIAATIAAWAAGLNCAVGVATLVVSIIVAVKTNKTTKIVSFQRSWMEHFFEAKRDASSRKPQVQQRGVASLLALAQSEHATADDKMMCVKLLDSLSGGTT